MYAIGPRSPGRRSKRLTTTSGQPQGQTADGPASTMRIWQIPTPQTKTQSLPFRKRVRCASLSLDGRRVALAADDLDVFVYETATGKQLATASIAPAGARRSR